jgi:MFS family permease
MAGLAYFAVMGLADGVWLARIPAVKENLGLSDGRLGVALLAAPVALVLVAAIADRLIDRFGSARLTVAGGLAMPLIPVAIGLAGSVAALMAALFAFGAAGGLLDVSLNAQAVRVERGYGRPLINSFHACYSFGGLLGAVLGGLFAWAGIGPAATFAAVGVPLAVLAAAARSGLLRGLEPRASGGSDPARGTSLRIVVLGLLAFCSLLGEGAAGSWSAVYLHDNLATSAAFAALGYAAFSVTMAVGRLSGDRLAARFGPGRMVTGGGLVAAAGLALALAWVTPVAGLTGFALFGAGLSTTFPQLLSAAGNVETGRSGSGIARVAGAGYLGVMAGPVVIGGCASLVGLRLALAIPVMLALCLAGGGRAAAIRPQAARGAPSLLPPRR